MNKRIITAILLASLLSPNYFAFSAEAKNISTPRQPSKQFKATVTDYRLDYVNADWWDKFHDPILKSYVLKAMDANHDLKIATLRVAEFQALVRESFGKELPGLGLGVGFSRYKTSDNVAFGDLKIPEYTQNAYGLPLTANYELDLWRKNREKTLSVAKELETVGYDEKAAYISLSAATATTYFNVVKTDKLIKMLKDIISLRENVLELMKIKNSNGLCTTTDVVLADKALTEAQSGLNDIQKYNSIFLNQLAVLTGQSVDSAATLERASLDDLNLSEDLPSSIQSDVVLKRPDILRAEAQLQKARIDINIARKDFLPDIGITGQFGFNSNDFSKTFNWDSYIAEIGVNLAQSPFSGGQKKARLKMRKVQYEELLQNYQKTILTSFQEVNDSLANLKYDSQKDKYNLSRIKAEENNLDQMTYKNEVGALAYLDLLQYKERVLVLKQEQIQSKTDCLIDLLSLYKSVGGSLRNR